MKKYVILLTGTLLAIGAIWAIGMMVRPTVTTVKTVTLTELTALPVDNRYVHKTPRR